jgi:hypothetical protein
MVLDGCGMTRRAAALATGSLQEEMTERDD